jgi:class 3 adenylate cyclase
MDKKSPGYDELKDMVNDLQRQLTRSLRVEQELHDTRYHLDRDLARFKGIQRFNERAINAVDIREFVQITVESIIEIFEVSCSAFLSYDLTHDALNIVDSLGLDESLKQNSLKTDWMKTQKLLRKGSSFIVEIDPDQHPWGALGLCQMIGSPYYDINGALAGIILGGRSIAKKDFYDEIKEEVTPAFTVFAEQVSALLKNLETKGNLERTVEERTRNLTLANEELEKEIIRRKQTEEQLRVAEREAKDLSEFLKKMFGRYLSPEVMDSLLENPAALELGGAKRKVTIMITDLRGFTALAERLDPEQVVTLLNSYFETMLEVTHRYQGAVNEIIGDSILVIFGAPQEMPDRAQRAIACAITMQNAMAEVNEKNRERGLPGLEMGIGLHDTEVIVGNIGSSKRVKYSVVGSGVNLTSRIESYTVGGQILISESVYKEAGGNLRIDAQRDVLPKGALTPLKIYQVGGIAGQYNLALEAKDQALVTLTREIPIRYTILEGKDIERKELKGSVIRLSKNCAEITLCEPIIVLTNLKMNLGDVDEQLSARDFYGKVIEPPEKKNTTQLIRFTSIPPEVDAYFQAHLKLATS